MEFTDKGVLLRYDDRVATTALFAYLRMKHVMQTGGLERYDRTDEWAEVVKRFNVEDSHSEFNTYSLVLHENNEQDNDVLYRYLIKEPYNVAALLLVQNTNRKA